MILGHIKIRSYTKKTFTVYLVILALPSGLTGCLSPIALDHLAIAYIKATADVNSK